MSRGGGLGNTGRLQNNALATSQSSFNNKKSIGTKSSAALHKKSASKNHVREASTHSQNSNTSGVGAMTNGLRNHNNYQKLRTTQSNSVQK